MHCAATTANTSQLVWEAAQIGSEMFTRGIGCPQAMDSHACEFASSVLQPTLARWWQQFNDELAAAVLAYAN
jgi:hypothetical protein